MGWRRAGTRAAAGAAVAALLLCTAAPARDTKWRVSGALSGTYDNSTSWIQCTASRATGSASEHIDLDVRLRPAATARYTRGNPQFGAIFNIDVGGTWTMNGAYAPRHRDANGNESCSAPVPIACGGNVTNPRASQRSPVAILFQRRGRRFLGQFTSFVEVSEGQSGQPSVCNPDTEDDTLAVVPLFGLGRASATAPFVTGIFEMPVSRLSRRRAFSVRVTPTPDRENSCDDFYDSCSQTNGLGMQLTFKPVR